MVCVLIQEWRDEIPSSIPWPVSSPTWTVLLGFFDEGLGRDIFLVGILVNNLTRIVIVLLVRVWAGLRTTAPCYGSNTGGLIRGVSGNMNGKYHNHTVTQSHCHTVTQSHSHTVKLSHCHTVKQSNCHTVKLSHFHTVTQSNSFTFHDTYLLQWMKKVEIHSLFFY